MLINGMTVTLANGSNVASISGAGDFSLRGIAVGADLRFPGEVPYSIIAVDAVARSVTIDAPYAGTSKVAAPLNVVAYSGAIQNAEAALLQLAQSFGAFTTADPFDTTPGRAIRVGDFGGHGQTAILSDNHDLDAIVTPGRYAWTNPPVNAPSPTGAHALEVSVGTDGSVIQAVTRLTATSAGMISYWRNVFLDAAGAVASKSPWVRGYNNRNVLAPITFDGIYPTGGLFERANGTTGTTVWEAGRDANGYQTINMTVQVNVASTSNQTFNLPTGWNFVGGSIPGGSVRNLTNAPNVALHLPNLQMVDVNTSNVQLRLGTAGTSADPTSDAEKLVICVTGRWR